MALLEPQPRQSEAKRPTDRKKERRKEGTDRTGSGASIAPGLLLPSMHGLSQKAIIGPADVAISVGSWSKVLPEKDRRALGVGEGLGLGEEEETGGAEIWHFLTLGALGHYEPVPSSGLSRRGIRDEMGESLALIGPRLRANSKLRRGQST
ncbi:hypothetical protein AXG93_4804s1100 [Marchantia polymorpha subsp. ruderalis]|uniref:Uncharacterized protein n=1 Tax=Marchantia polymorpha subsp. ruderalis TaxID=1480154 RepID=A0A176VPW4_MARPO|nr:hypothetical protein AXG93_4804s1100 [Marchantia polymorpha subsp. ruderalis]